MILYLIDYIDIKDNQFTQSHKFIDYLHLPS